MNAETSTSVLALPWHWSSSLLHRRRTCPFIRNGCDSFSSL